MSSSGPRRSSRRRKQSHGQDSIVAPGFGTKSDIEQLSRDLGGSLPVAAVEAMMQSRGRGIRAAKDDKDGDGSKKDGGGAKNVSEAQSTPSGRRSGSVLPVASPSTSNAWADFIKEEGVSLGSTRSKRSKPDGEDGKGTKVISAATAIHVQGATNWSYDLSVLKQQTSSKKTQDAKKQKGLPSFGSLVQTGTLDSTVVGRKSLTSASVGPQHLAVPTVLLPSIAITKVIASCNAAHAICIDHAGTAYGWGRNEQSQLTSSLPSPTVPTPQVLPTVPAGQVSSAAVGKSHSLLLINGAIHAVGSNESGQCGWRQSTKQGGSFKPSLVLSVVKSTTKGGESKKSTTSSTPVMARIECGEDFSMALCEEGYLYSTGSSEFGQLGTGETGEFFVTASKLAFTNGYGFQRQTVFTATDGEQSSSSKAKPTPINSEQPIRIQAIACGKHHTLALEAPRVVNDGDSALQAPTPRLFTWGCGDYGCLGHGRQHDEYYPRLVQSSLLMPRSSTNAAGVGVVCTGVAAGSGCCLVLTEVGHVYYWGKHKSSGEAAMRPQLVEALANNQHVVTHISSGSASVVCCTSLGATVVWGQGPNGELGLGTRKSSAKPTFLESLNGVPILDLSCGQGCTLFVVPDDDKGKKDGTSAEALPKVDVEAVEGALGIKASK